MENQEEVSKVTILFRPVANNSSTLVNGPSSSSRGVKRYKNGDIKVSLPANPNRPNNFVEDEHSEAKVHLETGFEMDDPKVVFKVGIVELDSSYSDTEENLLPGQATSNAAGSDSEGSEAGPSNEEDNDAANNLDGCATSSSRQDSSSENEAAYVSEQSPQYSPLDSPDYSPDSEGSEEAPSDAEDNDAPNNLQGCGTSSSRQGSSSDNEAVYNSEDSQEAEYTSEDSPQYSPQNDAGNHSVSEESEGGPSNADGNDASNNPEGSATPSSRQDITPVGRGAKGKKRKNVNCSDHSHRKVVVNNFLYKSIVHIKSYKNQA